MMTKRIIHSLCHNPYLNLAFEDYLFRKQPAHHQAILIWQNRPCVVIGRGQNPWAECDLDYLLQHQFDLVRRQSGGGAVFNDFGNVNFSYIGPNAHTKRHNNYAPLLKALQKADLIVTENSRGDLTCCHKNKTYKVSGSAYRMSGARQFHHFSLLINSNLNHLRQALQSKNTFNKASGVQSTRSSVINLNDINRIGVDELIESYVKKLGQIQDWHSTDIECITEHSIKDIDYCQHMAESYQQDKWLYGKTLPFNEKISLRHQHKSYDITIDVHHGIMQNIEGCSTDIPTSIVIELQRLLEHKPRHHLEKIISDNLTIYN